MALNPFPAKKNRSVGAWILIVVGGCALLVLIIVSLFIGLGTVGWQATIRSGNETTAAQTIDNLRRFQAQYASRNKGKFATFDELVTKVGLDERFRGELPIVNGYRFTMRLEDSSGSRSAAYFINADPMVLGDTGTRHFYSDSTLSTIKATDENRPARADDPSI
jgi:type II secretory pathway pseudopilin PulG